MTYLNANVLCPIKMISFHRNIWALNETQTLVLRKQYIPKEILNGFLAMCTAFSESSYQSFSNTGSIQVYVFNIIHTYLFLPLCRQQKTSWGLHPVLSWIVASVPCLILMVLSKRVAFSIHFTQRGSLFLPGFWAGKLTSSLSSTWLHARCPENLSCKSGHPPLDYIYSFKC